MSMIYHGTVGKTKKELTPYYSLKKEKMHNILKELKNSITISNTLFFKEEDEEKIKIKQTYKDLLKDYYNALVQYIPFNDEGRRGINNWIKKKTNGKFKEALKKINPNDIAFLVNCIYFKEDWKVSFKKGETFKGEFYIQKKQYKVDMMLRRKSKELYGEHKIGDIEFKSCTLPYKKKGYKMVFLKPTNIMEFESLFFKKGNFLTNVISEQEETKLGSLQIPKFKIRYRTDLKDKFQSMGIKKLFEFGYDYDMFESKKRVGISEIIHESFIEINEEGTEAAAVTMGKGSIVSYVPTTPDFILDKPFIAILCYKHFPLFILRYVNPEKLQKNMEVETRMEQYMKYPTLNATATMEYFPHLKPDIIMKNLVKGQESDFIFPVDNPRLENVNLTELFDPIKYNFSLVDKDPVVVIRVLEKKEEIPIVIPIKVLDKHEVVHISYKKFGKYSITYCPLTDSALMYEGIWHISGKLYNSNLVLYDKKTKGYMPQMLGMIINGPKKGKFIPHVPLIRTTWGNIAKKSYKNVLLMKGWKNISYDKPSYVDYRKDKKLWFNVVHKMKKEEDPFKKVIGVYDPINPKGYYNIEKQKIYSYKKDKLVGITKIENIFKYSFVQCYAFAWHAFFPKTLQKKF
jgi:serpin B